MEIPRHGRCILTFNKWLVILTSMRRRGREARKEGKKKFGLLGHA